MIKYVIFDMGGVLKTSRIRSKLSPTKLAFYQLAKYTKADPDEMINFVKSAEIKIMNGKLSESDFFRAMKAKLKIRHSSRLLKKMADKYYREINKFDQDVFAILKSVKKNYKIALITDVYPMHRRSNKKEGFYKHFNYIVTSLEAKQTKLEGKQKIYKIMLKKIKARPGECIFIDDKEQNLVAPTKMGIKTIHFKNAKQLKFDLKKLGITV